MATMAEVLGRHRFWAAGSACRCDQMFYDTRLDREEMLIEHELHVAMELHEAGFGRVVKMVAPCPKDFKRSYVGEKAASDSLAGLDEKVDRAGLEPYECVCGSWHLGHP